MTELGLNLTLNASNLRLSLPKSDYDLIFHHLWLRIIAMRPQNGVPFKPVCLFNYLFLRQRLFIGIIHIFLEVSVNPKGFQNGVRRVKSVMHHFELGKENVLQMGLANHTMINNKKLWNSIKFLLLFIKFRLWKSWIFNTCLRVLHHMPQRSRSCPHSACPGQVHGLKKLGVLERMYLFSSKIILVFTSVLLKNVLFLFI